MKFALYTICVSPHQIPLAKALIARIGAEEYRYVHIEPQPEFRKSLGWCDEQEPWILRLSENPDEGKRVIETSDILMSCVRDYELFKKRGKYGRTTLYCSERWFKPVVGFLRLLYPSYLKMAWQYVRLLRSDNNFFYYPIGIHAAEDMARLCGLFAGDLRCLFRAPRLRFESKPGGAIRLLNGSIGERYCLNKMRMWGYFVEPSKFVEHSDRLVNEISPAEMKILWVGRLLNWKRVDTIVRAVCALVKLHSKNKSLHRITLDIYGTGKEEPKIRKLVRGYEDVIRLYPPVPIKKVRQLMRSHNVYILSSNAFEGWGAVINEAMEEGMTVIGTYEAGGSATILPTSNLFHAGDWRTLSEILRMGGSKIGIGMWTAHAAADALLMDLK